MLTHEFLVVGGGLAGLTVASCVSGSADTAVLGEIYPTRSHGGAAQRGFNAAMGRDHCDDAHVFDTVKGIKYLEDGDAIEALCSNGPKVTPTRGGGYESVV